MLQIINWRTFIPWIFLAALAATLVLLSVRHRDLRESFVEHRRSDMRVQARQYLPAFRAPTVAGESVTVGEGPEGTRQVLIILTSTCPFCRKTLPTWKQMATDLSSSAPPGSHIQLVALTSDSMRVAAEYAKENQLPFPLVPFPTTGLVSMYRGFVVPQTIVIDGEGRVLFARHGVISTKAAVDSVIEATRLPVATDTARSMTLLAEPEMILAHTAGSQKESR